MASIKKDDKTGTYYFILDLPRDPVTGKRRQAKRRGFKNKKEAQAAAAALLHELTVGTHVQETNMTFEEFGNQWISYYSKVGNVKVSTIRSRSTEVKTLMKYFKKIPIRNITKSMYQDSLIDMKTTLNLKNGTISNTHGTARMIFKRALELDLIKADPSQFAKLPRSVTTVDDIENRVEIPKYMEKHELNLFLETALKEGLDGDYVTFLTLAYTGMRIGEFAVLRESDINAEESTISITKTYYNPSNHMQKYELLTPKTESSIREIEVDPMVITEIMKYLQSSKEFKMRVRNSYYDKKYIVPNKDKHPGYPRTIKQYEIRMARLLKKAGLSKSLTPHSLRHTHTSLLAEAGIPLQEIMDRLGHKDDKTTKLVYLHVTKTRKKEASHKFGEFMRNL